MNLDKIKNNIKKYDSNKLCEMIASARYLKLDQEIIIVSMTELGLRRANGENFNFEDRISNIMKEFPEINTEMPDIREMLIKAVKK